MKPLHLALAALALALLGGVFLLLDDSGTPLQPDVAVVTLAEDGTASLPTPTLPQAESTTRLDVAEISASTTSGPVDLGDTMPASYRAALGGLVGRLVEENGDPVSGLAVELVGGGATDVFPPLDAVLATGSAALQTELGSAVSNDEGRFAFPGVEPRILGVLLVDPGGPRALLQILEETPVSGNQKDLGDIVLPRGVTFTGVVVDELRQPLAGVRVRATDLEPLIISSGIADFRAGSGLLIDEDGLGLVVVPPPSLQRLQRLLPFPTTVSDANGRWTLPGVAPGLVSVVLDDGVHQTTVEGPHPSGPPGGTRDLGEMVLPAGLTLAGQVIDEAGRPVPGAEVMAGNQLIFGQVAILHPPVLTDEQGRFEVAGLRDGLARAAARRSPEHAFAVDTGAGRPDVEAVTVVLPSPRTLTLALLDEQQQPIDEVTVFARSLPRPEAAELPDFLIEPLRREASVSRDDEGRWVLGDLDPGYWDVALAAEGYGSLRRSFDLTLSDVSETITLQRAIELTVKVVRDDEQRQPLEWARVSVRASGDGRPRDGPPQVLTAARSDAEGLARLHGLNPGEYLLEVSHPAFAIATLPLVVPLEDGVLPEVALQLGGTVTGTVLENGGPPHQLLMVTLRTEEDEAFGNALPRMTLTAPDGSFSFADVAPGQVALKARERLSFSGLGSWWEPFAMTALAEQTLWVASAQQTEATLVVGSTWAELDTGFVDGRLLINGQPAVGWKVRTWGGIRRSVTTAEDGSFVMGQLEAGKVTLMFQQEGSFLGAGSIDNTTFELGVDERRSIEVALQTGAVEGRVLSGLDGRPIRGANVMLQGTQPKGGGWGGRGGVTVTDESGRYRFPVVSEGDYSVSAQADGFARKASKDFAVSRLSTVRGIDVTLEQAVAVSGRVVFADADDEDGPPSWIWLSAHSDRGGSASTRVDKDSLAFVFDDLSANSTWTFELMTNSGVAYEPIEVSVGHGRDDLQLVFRQQLEEPLPEEEDVAETAGSDDSEKDDGS